MSQFIYLYRGGEREASPERMQQVMQKWMAWLKELSGQGPHEGPWPSTRARRQGREGQARRS